MNQSGDDQAECPLCMEPFEVDDLNFFPCTCGYQICRFCWHRIRTDENGLCPACRKAYPENPADFKPLSQEQVAKLKAEKRQKEQQKKQKATESRKHLANVRVVQKNLVFVVGLPIRLADPNVLKKHEYFGKFGKIQKVVINQSTSYAGAMGPSASAYVTYNRYEDALRAIQAINNIWVDNRQIKTSLGTTKYCSHFIKAQTCPKPDCMYLHDLGDPEASFTKEEMQRGKHQEYEKNLFEQFNNSMSQERKTTPSPPALGNSLPNSDCTASFPNVNKEAWPSLQNGTTQSNTGGGTGPTFITSNPEIVLSTTTSTTTTSSACTNNAPLPTLLAKPQQTQPQPPQPSKMKQKDKNNSNEKSTNNKRKGKEKQINGINSTNHISTSSNNISNNNNVNNNNNNITSNSSTSINDKSNSNNIFNNNNSSSSNNNNNNNIVADKHDSLAKNNKEKEKRVIGETEVENDVNSRVQSFNNRSSSLYSNETNLFSNSNFNKKSPTGLKDSLPLPNGFIKVPENVTVNYETNSGDRNTSLSSKDTQDRETRLLTNTENERLTAIENEKPLVNGYLNENLNGSFEKISCNQKSNYSYQNGNINSSISSNCQQNIFNNYISINKFGGQLKNENLVGESNEAFLNQNSHILGQQNFLLKQQLAQQQRNQPNLQQMLIQHQQNVYQQPQNQYSQDFRLIQQQSQQPLNGFHSQSQHFNYMQQPNLRDQLLLQQKQSQLILNNYSPSGNNFIHFPNNDDLIVVDNLIPQHKYIENGLNHANMYSSECKLKDNRKVDDNIGEKGNGDIHNRIGDDELGFDPFHETQKALADLMEKELLIQQNKQALQHKNDHYYHQCPQNYQNPHTFDNCGRGLNQFQVNVLNQQNHMMGGKLLAQIHSQQILNSNNQKSGSNRLDGVRSTLPPPGFGSPSQNGPPGHMNNFGQGAPRNSNSSRKILPFMNLSNGENSFQPHYIPNGVAKPDDWPESLRSLVQEGNTSSPSSGSPSFSSGPKVWSNVGNCSDWTALDPAIVSSSRPQHLSLHTQSLLNNQGLSQLHQTHLQNQMCQLNIGSVLSHNNWSTPRQNGDNWSSHIQTTVPPPGFKLHHAGAEIKKPVLSGIEGLE